MHACYYFVIILIMSSTISTETQTEFVEQKVKEVQADKHNEPSKELIEAEEVSEEIEFGCPHDVYDKITNIRSNCTH
uniref:Secreted protein n=1 Tax=Panagrolaimus sp. ES5 TaxID=591445 RepID=A0AC34F656_9BILA